MYLGKLRTCAEKTAGDSWHSCILISESSFIFADEMNHFRHFHTSSAPCLKGFKKYQVLVVLKILVLSNTEGNNTKGYRHKKINNASYRSKWVHHVLPTYHY